LPRMRTRSEVGGDVENSTIMLPDEWNNCHHHAYHQQPPVPLLSPGIFQPTTLYLCIRHPQGPSSLHTPPFFSETVRDKILDHNRPHRYKHEICISLVQTAMKGEVRYLTKLHGRRRLMHAPVMLCTYSLHPVILGALAYLH